MSTPLTQDDLTRVLEAIKSNLWQQCGETLVGDGIQAGIDAISTPAKWPRFFEHTNGFMDCRYALARGPEELYAVDAGGNEIRSRGWDGSIQEYLNRHLWRELTEAQALDLLDKKPDKPKRMMQSNEVYAGHGGLHAWQQGCNVDPKCIPVATDLGKPGLGDTVEHPQFPSALVICDAEQDANGTVGVLGNGLRLSLKACSLTVTAKAKLRVEDVLRHRTHVAIDLLRDPKNYPVDWYEVWQLKSRGPRDE